MKRSGPAGRVRFLFREKRYKTFKSDGKADPGDIGPAELLNEMVVPAAAKDGVLCTKEFRRDLKRCPRIIIESPDHFRVDFAGNLKEAEE